MPAGCFLPRLIRYHRVLYFLLILTKAEQFCFLNSFISIGTTDQEVAVIQLIFFLRPKGTFLYMEYEPFI